jgi:prepilin-type processing-associated H-X9-DG protein
MTARFTLIELLCSIGIIALLAGLLLPVVGKFKESARSSACSGNLRQIGQAINAYAADSKDVLPTCERMNSLYGVSSLKGALAGNLPGDSKVFACPSDLLSSSPVFTSCGTSYEWNTFVNGRKIDKSSFIIAGMTIVSPLLGDANAVHGQRRNYLYSDGRVMEALEVLINNSAQTLQQGD